MSPLCLRARKNLWHPKYCYCIHCCNKQQSCYGRFPRLRRGWPAASHSSFLHFLCSCASSLFEPRSLMSLSTTCLHVILGLPLPLTLSTTYDMFFFLQSPSSFRNTCPSHLNRFRFTTSNTNSIPISPLAPHSALYPSETHNTSIVPSLSLSAPIFHSAPHSLPMSHFHTPSHSSHTSHTCSLTSLKTPPSSSRFLRTL